MLDSFDNPIELPIGRWRRLEPYWLLIALFLIGAAAAYITHLTTGWTPDRVAFTIPAFDLPVYWYGVIIISGVLLGGLVVARLARRRALRAFLTAVPAAVRTTPLTALPLNDALRERLARHQITHLGRLLYQWSAAPASLGLRRLDQRAVAAALTSHADPEAPLPRLEQSWLDDAPWRQWSPDHVWNGVIWCLVLGVVGARLYHILTPSPSLGITTADYFRSPGLMLNIRQGGLGIWGGIVGGLLGLILFTWRNRIDAVGWADLGGVGLALGQAVGRWGNFVNQELYGGPTNVAWAVAIDPAYRLPGFEDVARFHPAFLYESLWNFLAFLVLLTLALRHENWLKRGDLMSFYLIFYAIGRTLLDTVRLDNNTVAVGGLAALPTATVVAILVALAMAAGIAWRHRRPQPAPL